MSIFSARLGRLAGAAASAEQPRLPSSLCPALPGGSLCVPRKAESLGVWFNLGQPFITF